MLDVCLLGTGGMMPLPRRWLTALMCRYNGKNILIDCGEGTQVAIKEKGWTFKPIDVICITHYLLTLILLNLLKVSKHWNLKISGLKLLE